MAHITIYKALIFITILIRANSSWSDQNVVNYKDFRRFDQLTHSEQQQWIRLLGYKKTDGGWQATADNSDFFISETGGIDPRAEYEQLRTSLQSDLLQQCRFPARVKWIYQINKHNKITLSHCTDYLRWRNSFENERISIIYATPSMESPSAMFGHNFLRLYDAETPFLLSSTLNFNALVPVQTNALNYLVKGLGGGYWGAYDVKPMHRRIREYAGNQSRHLWEYQLTLAPDKISKIIDLAWEARKDTHRYYFTSENCSYRLIELLAAVDERIAVKTQLKKNIPIETISQLKKLGLIENVNYYPAEKWKLQSELNQMARAQREKVYSLLLETKDETEKSLSSASAEERYMAIKLLNYTINQNKNYRRTQHEKFYLIGQTIQEPLTVKPITPKSQDPTKTNASTKFSIGIKNEEDVYGSNVKFRYSGYDMLENPLELNRPATFEFLSASVWLANSDITLEKLTLLNLESLPDFTPFFHDLSWSFSIGATESIADRKLELRPELNGGLGASLHLENVGFSALAVAGGLYNENIKNNLDYYLGYKTSLFGEVENLSYRLKYERNYLYRDQFGFRSHINVDLFYKFSSNWSIEFTWSRWHQSEVTEDSSSFSLNHYF